MTDRTGAARQKRRRGRVAQGLSCYNIELSEDQVADFMLDRLKTSPEQALDREAQVVALKTIIERILASRVTDAAAPSLDMVVATVLETMNV